MNQELDVSFWPMQKILTAKQAEAKAEELRQAGKKIVTINGSFDLLHAGHLNFIGESKVQGDVLFVGLNSDQSIKAKKGPSRPFISTMERAGLLASLTVVDFVVPLDEDYDALPQIFIRLIKPDIHANGSEYGENPEQWIEWAAMSEVGAAGYVVSRRPGLSTTELIQKIKASV